MKLKIAAVWFAIVFLSCFYLTTMPGSGPMDVAVLPVVPREGEPVLAVFKLNNPASEAVALSYSLYANGELVQRGSSTISPLSSKTYQYAYRNPLRLGEQVSFALQVESGGENWERVVSIPSYPPQIMSSFVSFASFSTSVMGFMASSAYYESTFGRPEGWSVGLAISIVLIALLIYMELTDPSSGPLNRILRRLRIRFSYLSWMLLIIFIGIVYTRIVLILTT